ncbi:MAG TPA: hypothetical protein VI792_12365 [Candidatus Eisenbacteria bacterium]
MPALTAGALSPVLNRFSIHPGPTRSIVVGTASQLAQLGEVTVSGMLLSKQIVTLDPATGKRAVALGKSGGTYVTNAEDGDLHFCLGTVQGQPHIAYELQNAKAWVAEFNAARGSPVTVTGFFRCMFEHPGFRSNDDAHIFEIHPVRAVAFAQKLQAFDVGVPDQKSLHTWSTRLSQQDAAISVTYDAAKDTLTFSGMGDGDTNYVFGLKGQVSAITLKPASSEPASFTFDCKPIGHPVKVICLKGTSAALQLAKLKKTSITLTALRNIDLPLALKNKYVINLLGIAIA